MERAHDELLIRLDENVKNLDRRFLNWTIEHGKEHAESANNTKWLIGALIAFFGVMGPIISVALQRMLGG